MREELPIRMATTHDVPELVRLKALTMEGWPFPVDVDADPSWRERAAAEYRRQLDAGDTVAFVIDDPAGNRLVASITASLERHVPGPRGNGISGYLQSMVTEPEYRRRGLGGRLLDAAMDWCRDRGAGRVRLWATESGLPVYRKAGFREIESPFVHMNADLR